MKPLTYLALVLGACLYATTIAAESASDEILGNWYTKDNESQVKIVKKTDEDGKSKYFGTLVWFENPVYEEDDPEAGVILHDRKNKDEARQADPLLGLQMLKNFSYDSDDKEWNAGTIYDPNVGKTYKCTIRIADDPDAPGKKILNVRGYIGIPTFGRTEIWKQALPEKNTE